MLELHSPSCSCPTHLLTDGCSSLRHDDMTTTRMIVQTDVRAVLKDRPPLHIQLAERLHGEHRQTRVHQDRHSRHEPENALPRADALRARRMNALHDEQLPDRKQTEQDAGGTIISLFPRVRLLTRFVHDDAVNSLRKEE